jgi:anaerobic magnesium-protoporphyrin IX monomethyl ester cyclase
MIPAKSLLLLSCRSPFLDDSKIYCPLANLYLKSYINKYLPDVSVTIGDDEYDLNDLSHMEPFDAIGISVMTPQRQEAVALARAIKYRWPAKTVIVGGPHVRHYCHQLYEESSYDYLVPMDGERALVMILSGRATTRIVRDILTRDEVAAQPRPDRSSPNAIEVLRKYHYFLGEREATTMMTARGCPEQCTFCEDAMTQVRSSSLENIHDQLNDIVHLGYRGVYIFDDLFTMSIRKIRPICDQFSKFDLVYRCNAQARYFTKWGDEMAKLLAETGCYEIAFGAESGSQKIIDNIRKRCTIEQNYKTVEYAKKHGLIVKAFILIGLPGETWQTLKETESFIRDSGCDDYQIAVYMPFKGTKIREAIDSEEPIDISLSPAGIDGEISGAYGIKGGETAYEVRTSELSTDDLKSFREYLVTTYRPNSHMQKWANKDRFFEQAHAIGNNV